MPWKTIHNEKYLKSFSKYKGIFITHEELLIILNNINKQYKLPKFNYNFEEKIENEAFKKPQENENILNSKDGYKKFNFKTNSNIISNIDNNFKDYYEKYYFIYDFSINFFNTINQLILKIYFLYKNIDNKQLKRNEKYKSYIDFIKNKSSEKEQIEQCKEFIPKLYLVCYYYHCYPYYYPFKLNKKIVNEIIKVSKSEYKKKQKELFFSLGNLINECYEKIINNECIINENITNTFHKLLIQLDIACSDDDDEITNFYQELESFSFFDLIIENFFMLLIERDGYKINMSYVISSLDRRYINIVYYKDIYKYNNNLKLLPEDEFKITKWSEEMKIKKILVVYDNEDFLELVKSIDLTEYYEIEYLYKKDLDKFLIKRETNKIGLRIMKYYVITDINIADELYNTFTFYKNSFGITLIFLIYFYSNSLTSKTLGMKLNPILVNTKESIYNYFNDIKNKFKYYQVLVKNTLKSSQQIIEKDEILFKPINIQTEEKDNGWDFSENLNPSIFEQNFIIRNNNLIMDAINVKIYNLYEEKNLLDIFFTYYSTYFFISCPEEFNNNIQNVKKIIYAWTCQKIEKEQSFYYLMNEELRSGKLNRIKKYISFIYNIKLCISNHVLSTYNDVTYRGTKLDINFIKNIKKGKIIYNPCFWACSKEKEIAKSFIFSSKDRRNVLLIVKGNSDNNIDIDKEKLSFYDEKEILIFPFSSFILTDEPKLVKDKEHNYDYYEIYLEYIKENMMDDKVVNIKKKSLIYLK